MFEVNLKPLLMEAPLKNNIILGFDPGYHNGCQIAVIDKNGDFYKCKVYFNNSEIILNEYVYDKKYMKFISPKVNSYSVL